MKKLALLVITTILVSSCSIETKGDPFFVVSEVSETGRKNDNHNWYVINIIDNGKRIEDFGTRGDTGFFVGDTLILDNKNNGYKSLGKEFRVREIKRGRGNYSYQYDVWNRESSQEIIFFSNRKFPLGSTLILRKK